MQLQQRYIYSMVIDCVFFHKEIPIGELAQGEAFSQSQNDRVNSAVPDERDLLDLARQHEEQAFGTLVALCKLRLMRVAQRMLVDRMEAEPVVQEEFWRFWQSLPRYDAGRPARIPSSLHVQFTSGSYSRIRLSFADLHPVQGVWTAR